MTCETIRQLIRTGNDAEDDEGGAGEDFIMIIQKRKQEWGFCCSGVCAIRMKAGMERIYE